MSHSNLLEEARKLVALHPGMHLVEQVTDLILEGIYDYNLSYGGTFIIGSRWVRLVVNKAFPDTLPKLFFDTIPSGMSHFYADTSACVATIGELIEFTAKNPSLLKYWEKFVDAFIFTAHWFSEYRKYPFGDREHGAPGIFKLLSGKLGDFHSGIHQLIRLIKRINSEDITYVLGLL